jgi:hypothetical protein
VNTIRLSDEVANNLVWDIALTRQILTSTILIKKMIWDLRTWQSEGKKNLKKKIGREIRICKNKSFRKLKKQNQKIRTKQWTIFQTLEYKDLKIVTADVRAK